MTDKLSRFIEQARGKGIDPATIFLLLRSSGWKEREIADALAAQELALPIPERPGVGSARDALLHLLAFTALFAAAISLIYLLFVYIELAFPDPAQRVAEDFVEMVLSGIRAALAALLVAYPVFLLVWWMLLKEVKATPERAKSGVRRWLTSLTMFIAAVTIAGDLVTVVYYLVEGDLTIRFLLKVLALLLVTGGIFVYLGLTLRAEGEAVA